MSVHVDKTLNPERRTARRTLIAAVLAAGLVGLVGGAVGGAAGAMWVVQTMAAPKFSPKARNAVVEYAGMPAEGARPVDIAGLTRSGTPLHPCLVDFLEEQREVVGEADWRKVRLHPVFKHDEDIVNQLAFSSRACAITRGNDIYVNIPYTPTAIDQPGGALTCHELVPAAPYASGMSLPEYASSAARSYAEGARPEDNAYENEARDKARELLRLWALSPQRVQCHPDQREAPHLRAPSERPEISFAIFSSEKGEYELVRHQLHKNRLLVRESPPVEAGSETEAG